MTNNNELKLDVLRELGNIGMGNAATSLSTMLQDEKIDMSLPEVDIVALADVPDLLGGAEVPTVGIYIEATGDISFYMMFLMTVSNAKSLVYSITQGATEELDDFGQSALREVGNIITAAYLNALSFMTQTAFLPQPPILAIDMAGAILGTALAEAQVLEDYILVLKNAFITESSNIEGHVFIIPQEDALDAITDLLLHGAQNE